MAEHTGLSLEEVVNELNRLGDMYTTWAQEAEDAACIAQNNYDEAYSKGRSVVFLYAARDVRVLATRAHGL